MTDHLFPKARAELLRLLFAEPEVELHLRDLARLSGLAVRTIRLEVANLRKIELILERRDGNRLYFRANTRNPIFPELQGIARKTTGLLSQLKEALVGIAGVNLAFVYGSFATGRQKSESDIDLLVIGEVGLRVLAPKLRIVSDALRREINPSVISKTSLEERLKTGDAYLAEITDGPKLWIIGDDDELARLA